MGQRCHGDEDLEWRSSSIRIFPTRKALQHLLECEHQVCFYSCNTRLFFPRRLIVVTLFAKVNISQVMFMFESRGTYYKKTNKDIEHFCCYCPGENCGACCHNRTDIKQPITGFIAKLKHNNYCTTIKKIMKQQNVKCNVKYQIIVPKLLQQPFPIWNVWNYIFPEYTVKPFS